MQRFKDFFFSAVEYVLGVVVILAGFSTYQAGPIEGVGPVGRVLGAEGALFFYGTIFICIGLYLIMSKILRNRRHHKYALMTVYLMGIFVIVLEWAIEGAFTFAQVDQIVIGVIAGLLWLRWKLKTEYVNPRDYDEIRQEILDEQALDEHNKT